MRAGILLIWWTVATASPNPHLARALKLMDDLDFVGAESALEVAASTKGNDRPTVLAILEKQALLAVYSQDWDRASEYFKRLLVLSPSYELSADYGPKAAPPFAAAKRWVLRNGALRFEAQPPRLAPGSIEEVAAKVAADPLSMSAKIRLHLRSGGRPWRAVEVVPTAGVGAVQTRAERVEWWAELLDSTGGTLALVGSQSKPLVASIGEPGATAAAEGEWSDASAEGGSPGSNTRALGVTALAVSAGSLAAGVLFTVRAGQDRARLEGAEKNEEGVVTGLTQREAFALDQSARTQSLVGTGLFGLTAALAVTGALLYWQGGSVGVAPSPGGIALAGTLP